MCRARQIDVALLGGERVQRLCPWPVPGRAGPACAPADRRALRGLADGDLVYTRLIERYTTLPLQAEEIHEIGLQQIEKLNQEYLDIAGPLLDTTSLEDIFLAQDLERPS